MINEFQRLLYKISCIAPICIILGLLLYMQDVSILFCSILTMIGIISCIYSIIFVKLCEKNLPTLMITADSITQDDGVVIMYVITYLVPIVGVIWKDNQIIWMLIGAVLILMLIKINNLSFCPVLLLVGYHCFKISLSTGTECVLVSKRKGIRSNKQIGQVIRISDNLMIEDIGGK